MNVFLISHRDEGQDVLLPAIRDEIRRQDPWLRCALVHDRPPGWKHRLWAGGQASVVVSMRPARMRPREPFAPGWATVWQQEMLDKIEECRLLEQAGLPVPRWLAVHRGETPDLSAFGPYVVVKPSRGAKGALVRIVRRDRAGWRPLDVECRAEAGTTSPDDPVIVQEYVHTGPWPTSYRVTTVFGEPIGALRYEASRSREAMPDHPREPSAFHGRNIVATSRDSTVDADVAADVLEMGRRVHGAFPSVPLLGTDIVRDHASGTLHVLEVNAVGWTFHLTSVSYARYRKAGIDLRTQFGGAAAVARGIVRRCRDPLGWSGAPGPPPTNGSS